MIIPTQLDGCGRSHVYPLSTDELLQTQLVSIQTSQQLIDHVPHMIKRCMDFSRILAPEQFKYSLAGVWIGRVWGSETRPKPISPIALPRCADAPS
jgi:hypothetical protein